MSTPFLGEVRPFGFNFAPSGWAFCDGQLLSIDQNNALFAILGTTYGGDGRTTFGLPDLRGRTAVHPGSEVQLGETAGVETVTLNADQLPAHGHAVMASADLVTVASPANAVMGAKGRGGVDVYAAAGNLTPLRSGTVEATGGGQAHDNLQPSLVVNFCIALEGVFPSPN